MRGADWLRDLLCTSYADSKIVPSGLCALRSPPARVPFALGNAAVDNFSLTIAADTQLHNREDLIEALGLKSPLEDGDLILAAYAKWGENCAAHLLGEFAFAIWDERRQHLFCCRDHIGFRAFLYWHSASRFVFAGDIEPILACPSIPRALNRRKLAALAVPTAHLLRHEETFHSGILSLPPGMWMIVDRSGIRLRRYWELQTGAASAIPAKPESVFEQLRELLFQAVECRLDRERPVATLLSGGLDSSAVAAIASRHLARKNRQLTAVAAVLPEESLGMFKDERSYIDEFKGTKNLNIRYVTAQGRGPFDSLAAPSRFAAFPLRSSRFFLDEECAKVAIQNGAQTLLSGVGGEFGITSTGERYYLESAITLRWFALLRMVRNQRASAAPSALRSLAGQVFR
ncbi:MAG: asparagine synthase-related protein, partial [Acidobacteriota bacterium]|nr:asparagine synthase-related protein [Acidobacteriota bacterium]